jgi:hypothetical protein
MGPKTGMVNITRNMPSEFYPSFIPIKGYLVSGVSPRIQLPGASILIRRNTFWKSKQN